MKIEHIALNVASVDEHVAWYTEHLGLKIVRKMNDPNHMHFIVDDSDQSMLELYSNPNVPVPDYAAMDVRAFHIAITVEDMDAEKERLMAAGATLAEDLEITPAGDKLLFLRDPWGVTVQLVQRKEPMI